MGFPQARRHASQVVGTRATSQAVAPDRPGLAGSLPYDREVGLGDSQLRPLRGTLAGTVAKPFTVSAAEGLAATQETGAAAEGLHGSGSMAGMAADEQEVAFPPCTGRNGFRAGETPTMASTEHGNEDRYVGDQNL